MYTANHHLATQNLPTIQSCAENRAWLEQAMAEFEQRGGVVQQCAIRVGGDVGGKWNGAGAIVLSTEDRTKDAEDAQRIRVLADKGAGITAIKYHLKIDLRRIKRLAQTYGIKIDSKRGATGCKGPNEANRKATAERGRKHRQELARQAWPMIEAGDSMNTIVKALGCSKPTLARAIEENGYVARGPLHDRI